MLQALCLEDIVVDNYDEVLMRLRALYGIRNTANTRLVAVNGPGGWGAGKNAYIDTWHMEVITVSNDELRKRLDNKKNSTKLIENARTKMEEYLSDPGILSVRTDKKFILNAFILRDVFQDLITEHNANGITVKGCMDIGKIAETTACLAFSLINDDGLMAFCESDFIIR